MTMNINSKNFRVRAGEKVIFSEITREAGATASRGKATEGRGLRPWQRCSELRRNLFERFGYRRLRPGLR